VLAHVCSQGGKVVHVLRSHICSLDFRMEPPFNYVDDDSGDVAIAGLINLSEVGMPLKSIWLAVCIRCPSV
jgi:hypothetical protein